MIKIALKALVLLLCLYVLCGLGLTAISYSKQKNKKLRIKHFYDGFVHKPASYLGIKLPKWWVIKVTEPIRR
ncbi:MAG: hypothetical protein VX016_00710 [Verrucomicrobiota bacterium]|nr:hypothetical protein [Verrucomicrobiota bacterium]|tara:strand:+ start:741 stop:956 length:216 start_codon:yes stop_codon:yes gene_type:complete